MGSNIPDIDSAIGELQAQTLFRQERPDFEVSRERARPEHCACADIENPELRQVVGMDKGPLLFDELKTSQSVLGAVVPLQSRHSEGHGKFRPVEDGNAACRFHDNKPAVGADADDFLERDLRRRPVEELARFGVPYPQTQIAVDGGDQGAVGAYFEGNDMAAFDLKRADPFSVVDVVEDHLGSLRIAAFFVQEVVYDPVLFTVEKGVVAVDGNAGVIRQDGQAFAVGEIPDFFPSQRRRRHHARPRGADKESRRATVAAVEDADTLSRGRVPQTHRAVRACRDKMGSVHGRRHCGDPFPVNPRVVKQTARPGGFRKD